MLWSGERNATLCSLSRIAVKMSVLLKMSTEATRPKQQQKECMVKKNSTKRALHHATHCKQARSFCAVALGAVKEEEDARYSLRRHNNVWRPAMAIAVAMAAGSWLTAAAITATVADTVALLVLVRH